MEMVLLLLNFIDKQVFLKIAFINLRGCPHFIYLFFWYWVVLHCGTFIMLWWAWS